MRENILVFNDKTDYTDDSLGHTTILKKEMKKKLQIIRWLDAG